MLQSRCFYLSFKNFISRPCFSSIDSVYLSSLAKCIRETLLLLHIGHTWKVLLLLFSTYCCSFSELWKIVAHQKHDSQRANSYWHSCNGLTLTFIECIWYVHFPFTKEFTMRINFIAKIYSSIIEFLQQKRTTILTDNLQS